ncbi:hypothetical protein COL516b_001975 [Colletotrichum fioriniae]|nr:uncharacterized protein COL516b_001975 [Colletotrichum fioriniae]KAJ0311269.1 hypothetical protein COL516b_001975 [Colletotrichum fioriniae]
MPDSIRDVEAQAVQPIAASTAAAPSASADIEVDSEVRTIRLNMVERITRSELAITGIDLSPIQPSWVPPNVKFEVDDVESPWVGSKKYNFIFSRYMAGSIADWQLYISRIFG